MHIKGGDKPPQGSQMAPEQAYHGCIIKSGYSEIGRPPFIPMKAAQWHMKPKWLNFPGSKNTWIRGRSSTSFGPSRLVVFFFFQMLSDLMNQILRVKLVILRGFGRSKN